MADNYNPNEIAKVKHLNEFARQLAIKLDGGTDPKNARNGAIYHAGTVAVAPFQECRTSSFTRTIPVANMYTSNSFYGFQLVYQDKATNNWHANRDKVPTVFPQILNLQATVGTPEILLVRFTSRPTGNAYPNAFYFFIGIGEKVATTFTGSFFMPETDIYLENKIDFTIIFEEE